MRAEAGANPVAHGAAAWLAWKYKAPKTPKRHGLGGDLGDGLGTGFQQVPALLAEVHTPLGGGLDGSPPKAPTHLVEVHTPLGQRPGKPLLTLSTGLRVCP